jgi:hydroxyethylthiazole kinase
MNSTLLKKVRSEKPLVHHITNWVTIYDCAQIVKSFGASPVMAHAPQEAAEMTSISSALVLNIGTLTEDIVASMIISGKAANRKGIPVILDVCGAGATSYRDQTCEKILTEIHADIIKGNGSEIARIAGLGVTTRGVDSSIDSSSNDVIDAARLVASTHHSTAVVTGKVDIIIGPSGSFKVSNGTEMMTSVVGTGCMAASVIGIFAAIEKNHALSAAAALSCYEIAAEIATVKAQGPLDFKNRLFDAVWALTAEDVERYQKVEKI